MPTVLDNIMLKGIFLFKAQRKMAEGSHFQNTSLLLIKLNSEEEEK